MIKLKKGEFQHCHQIPFVLNTHMSVWGYSDWIFDISNNHTLVTIMHCSVDFECLTG